MEEELESGKSALERGELHIITATCPPDVVPCGMCVVRNAAIPNGRNGIPILFGDIGYLNAAKQPVCKGCFLKPDGLNGHDDFDRKNYAIHEDVFQASFAEYYKYIHTADSDGASPSLRDAQLKLLQLSITLTTKICQDGRIASVHYCREALRHQAKKMCGEPGTRKASQVQRSNRMVLEAYLGIGEFAMTE